MPTLWNTNDTITHARRNRESVIGRILMPMYDVDEAVSINIAAKPVDGVALANSATLYYTAPSGAGTIAELFEVTLCNTHTAALAVDVYIVENGGSAGVATSIFRDTLQPGEQVTLTGPWFLGPSDKLYAAAATAALVSLRAEVLEWASQPTSLNLKLINGAALGSSLATYYTVSGFTQAILLSATMCNTDSSSRTPNLHVIHSGDSAAVKNRIWSDVLVAKETAILQPLTVLKVGDFIQAKEATGAVVSLRLTLLEVS